MDKYNLAVIGLVPGGYLAAIRAAQLGTKVAVIERDKPGGVCLNRGCIPSKAILKCAGVYEYFEKSDSYGIAARELTFDYSKVLEATPLEIALTPHAHPTLSEVVMNAAPGIFKDAGLTKHDPG